MALVTKEPHNTFSVPPKHAVRIAPNIPGGTCVWTARIGESGRRNAPALVTPAQWQHFMDRVSQALIELEKERAAEAAAYEAASAAASAAAAAAHEARQAAFEKLKRELELKIRVQDAADDRGAFFDWLTAQFAAVSGDRVCCFFKYEPGSYAEDMVYWLDVFLGRLLYPINKYDKWEKLLIIKGWAATGKSSIAKALSALLGDGYDAILQSQHREYMIVAGEAPFSPVVPGFEEVTPPAEVQALLPVDHVFLLPPDWRGRRASLGGCQRGKPTV